MAWKPFQATQPEGDLKIAKQLLTVQVVLPKALKDKVELNKSHLSLPVYSFAWKLQLP